MATYREMTFVSADSHVTEPIELYAERVDAAFRHRVPRVETKDGWRRLVAEGAHPRRLMSANQLSTAVVGGHDAAARLDDQARDGVVAEVIFPTWALNTCFTSEDPEFQQQLCRAYNDWAAETFGDRPTQLAPGLVPLLSIDDGIAEACRLADAGFRALMLPAQVSGRPYNDPAYDRFWTVAEELGLPLTFHSGTGYEPRIERGPGGAVINYLMGAQLDGPRVLINLAAGGALDRFPSLRVVAVETGASWMGWLVTQADAIYEDHDPYVRPKLSLKPSELIRRQCAASFMYDPVAVNNRHTTGIETLMWGNDYPHPEGTWPASQEVAAKQFDGVADEELRAIVGGNAARVFGFQL